MSAPRITCIAIAILAGIVTAGCSSVEVRKERQRIAIATDVFLMLPQASELSESFNATQVIAAQYADRSFSFEAHLESRPGKITIVALGALGGALFSISYDGVELRASGSVETQVINAEYVLADVLLAHWDVDWLNQHLQGASIEAAEDGESRFLSRQDELVVDINYDTSDPWGGKATLTHLERGYVLDIRTVEYTSQ
jgi:hypothetical protein